MKRIFETGAELLRYVDITKVWKVKNILVKFKENDDAERIPYYEVIFVRRKV